MADYERLWGVRVLGIAADGGELCSEGSFATDAASLEGATCKLAESTGTAMEAVSDLSQRPQHGQRHCQGVKIIDEFHRISQLLTQCGRIEVKRAIGKLAHLMFHGAGQGKAGTAEIAKVKRPIRRGDQRRAIGDIRGG